MKKVAKFLGIFTAMVVCLLVFIQCTLLVFVKPSNDREWSEDLAVLAYAEFDGDSVTVKNIRNFKYESVLDYTADYYDRTFDMNGINSVEYVVEPFSGVAAHTFVAFGFEDGSYVDISVEVRREKGEFYNIFKGIARRFELVYVIADERDVLKLRTNHRKDNVYLYPVKTSKEKMRAMFVDMLLRANELRHKPEFYHTLANNCTTNIVEHVNKISPNKVPFSYKYFLPKYSDELAFDVGLITGEDTIEQMRERYNVTAIAQKYGEDPDFSRKIREDLLVK